MKFKEWFDNKLIVNRFPTPKECETMSADIIINVSDEYIEGCYESAVNSGKRYYWFPMGECVSDMGINSIYAALQILYKAEENNKKVYLHCHAGVNRSPTVADCYHFMRTGNHSEGKRNRLIENVNYGHLPAIKLMEEFLRQCADAFTKDESMRGGYLDNSILKSQIK